MTEVILYHCVRFYKAFSRELSTHCVDNPISGFHGLIIELYYRCMIRSARDWYEKEAYEQTWSVRTLQRNIDTQYYYQIAAIRKIKNAVDAGDAGERRITISRTS